MVRRADAVANQKKVLEAAKKLLAEKGLNAEIKEIADEAGVGVGTLYRSYADKNALLTAVTLDSVVEFAELFDASMSESGFDAAFSSFLRAALSHSDRYGWLIAAALGWQLPEQALRILAEARTIVQIEKLITRGIDEGTLRSDLPIQSASLQILGHILLWTYREAKDLDVAVAEICDLFLAGARVDERAD